VFIQRKFDDVWAVILDKAEASSEILDKAEAS
jgi:hypothetical protein